MHLINCVNARPLNVKFIRGTESHICIRAVCERSAHIKTKVKLLDDEEFTIYSHGRHGDSKINGGKGCTWRIVKISDDFFSTIRQERDSHFFFSRWISCISPSLREKSRGGRKRNLPRTSHIFEFIF